MKYILKSLDESIKQSDNMGDLNRACAHYKKLLDYLEAIPGAKDPRVVELLGKICYTQVETQKPEENEELTMDRVLRDTEFVRANVIEYYKLMRNKLENVNTQSR